MIDGPSSSFSEGGRVESLSLPPRFCLILFNGGYVTIQNQDKGGPLFFWYQFNTQFAATPPRPSILP